MTYSDDRDLPLTERQIQVLDLLSHGLEREEVAVRLGLSVHSVKSHVRRAFARLGVRRTAHAVRVGFERGLLVAGSPLPSTSVSVDEDEDEES